MVSQGEQMTVYILIRTSNRPKYFKKMMDSIKTQTYKDIVTIVHTDNDKDTYVEGDIIVKGEILNVKGSAPYNLYNNTLLKSIPGEGWYCFLDDDDMLYDDFVIEKLVKHAKRDHINIGHVIRWDNTIWPKTWGVQKSFQTECFFLHTDHKDKASWWANKGGDHYYTKQLTSQLPINWIDEIIIAKAQEGKGNGKRYDLGERPSIQNTNTPERPGNICFQDVLIEFLKEIKTPKALRGKVGEIKTMQRMRAERLESKGKVRILSEEVRI